MIKDTLTKIVLVLVFGLGGFYGGIYYGTNKFNNMMDELYADYVLIKNDVDAFVEVSNPETIRHYVKELNKMLDDLEFLNNIIQSGQIADNTLDLFIDKHQKRIDNANGRILLLQKEIYDVAADIRTDLIDDVNDLNSAVTVELETNRKFTEEQIKEIIDIENVLIKHGFPKTANELNYVKSIGFTDGKISELTRKKIEDVKIEREKLRVFSVYKKIDTCAAEFKSLTPYMYSTYQRDTIGSSICESNPSKNKKIIILGGGPNRIGQGIEFDYCCCQASYSLKEAGYETIMVNCNPETVSTDYDTSDRLYFEPLVEEHVINIIKREQSSGDLLGVIAQFGGQTPIKLAKILDDNHIPILGTQYKSIDLAENREKFKNLLLENNFKQAESGIAKSKDEAINISKSLGFPIVIRPSYVLGGQGMKIVINEQELEEHIVDILGKIPNNKLLLDHYLDGAIEAEADAISDGKDVYIIGIMEHIEPCGIHSGDSNATLPVFSLGDFIIQQIKDHTKKIALALNTVGLINVQFAIKDDKVFVIEANPRASRTVPFISKAYKEPYVNYATKIMLGKNKVKDFKFNPSLKGYAIKQPVFSFDKFPNVNKQLGPEMKSTGESILFIDDLNDDAFLELFSRRKMYLTK